MTSGSRRLCYQILRESAAQRKWNNEIITRRIIGGADNKMQSALSVRIASGGGENGLQWWRRCRRRRTPARLITQTQGLSLPLGGWFALAAAAAAVHRFPNRMSKASDDCGADPASSLRPIKIFIWSIGLLVDSYQELISRLVGATAGQSFTSLPPKSVVKRSVRRPLCTQTRVSAFSENAPFECGVWSLCGLKR